MPLRLPSPAPLDGRLTPRALVIAAALASLHLALIAWGASLLL